jgi:rSAM/selenodomain-associated transferase 1
MAIGRAETPGDLAGVQVAVLAKAPIAGLAKTRLIPVLGAAGAARLQRRLTRQAVLTAQAAGLGLVTLWCTPDARHRFFRALHLTSGVPCLVQASGDLGERMHMAFRLHCAQGPLLLIGTDCPPLTPAHLRRAAQALCTGLDAVFHPAEDGGYAMVGLRTPQVTLFTGMRWSTDTVMTDTRARARDAGLTWCELETLWDLDEPADLDRLSHTQSVALGLAR